MSKYDFPEAEFAARRQSVQRALHDADLDWIIAIHPASIHWLTGAETKSYQSFQCLMVPAGNEPMTMLIREAERNEFYSDALADDLRSWGGPERLDPFEALASLAREFGFANKHIGFERPAYYLGPTAHKGLKRSLAGVILRPADRLIHDLRLLKSANEIAIIREASRIADISMGVFRDRAKRGRSELEITADIYHSILSAGAGQPASPVNFAAGPRSAFSHARPSSRKLEEGDFGSIEYGVPYCSYPVSIGRQFVAGPATARMLELYHVAKAALDACIAKICNGVPAHAPYDAAYEVLAGAGLEQFCVHTTGYCMAPAFPPATGEQLHLARGSNEILRANMQISICPSIFIGRERLGARLVDNVLVTATGAERLSSFPHDLITID